MERAARIRRQADFDRLLATRRLHAGVALVGFAAPGPGPGARIGVTAGKRIGGAVRRNRARRRIREAARIALRGPGSELVRAGINVDIVLIARPRGFDLAFRDLVREVALVGSKAMSGVAFPSVPGSDG